MYPKRSLKHNNVKRKLLNGHTIFFPSWWLIGLLEERLIQASQLHFYIQGVQNTYLEANFMMCLTHTCSWDDWNMTQMFCSGYTGVQTHELSHLSNTLTRCTEHVSANTRLHKLTWVTRRWGLPFDAQNAFRWPYLASSKKVSRSFLKALSLSLFHSRS